MDFIQTTFFLILFALAIVVMFAAGALFYWWTAARRNRKKKPRYLVVDKSQTQAEQDLDLMKKDLRDRQQLKAVTEDWENN